MTEPTHYEVLSLPKSLLEESTEEQIPQIIKQAYHRALLRHHPDKAQAPSSRHQHTSTYNRSTIITTSNPIYTVDQITRAYTTLSAPTSRSQYDRYLLTQQNSSKPSQSTFQTGIETIDLDDLDYSESPGTGETRWYRSCRCGNEQGFAFGEEDLEEAGALGELIVGCQDCSLWLRVCFAVVEDDDGTEEEAAAKQPG
ncbi:Diphthamide biosynthesis protein 4 [Cytospora mali]|uniref:Diphthamide biosynthesis protein 4 n=1 Tax=Cytospora mali TaxID=578113 RepID=A0A194UYF5_CYTMA|nr:Diphthamide biosynthesis protein 4 [Valsa mali var. pyri (nom. inval.)]